MRLYTLLKKIIDRIDQIGTIYESPDISEKTVTPNGQYNVIGSLTLTKGTYLIEGSCQFDIDSETFYNLALRQANSVMALYRGRMWGGGSGNVSRTIKLTQTTKFTLAVYIGGSSDRIVSYPRFYATKLRGGIRTIVTRAADWGCIA